MGFPVLAVHRATRLNRPEPVLGSRAWIGMSLRIPWPGESAPAGGPSPPERASDQQSLSVGTDHTPPRQTPFRDLASPNSKTPPLRSFSRQRRSWDFPGSGFERDGLWHIGATGSSSCKPSASRSVAPLRIAEKPE